MAVVQFILDSSKGQLILDGENNNSIPIGWDEQQITLARSETYSGMMQKVNVNLTFIKQGYIYLKELYDIEGILAACTLTIQYYNNNTASFVTKYIGEIDFSTKQETDKEGQGITFSVLDTTFAKKLFSRESIEIRYDDLKTLDEETIIPFANEFHTVSVVGQAIADTNINSSILEDVYTYTGGNRNNIFAIENDITNDSFQDVFKRSYPGAEQPSSILTSDCWYFAKVNTTISFNYSLKFKWEEYSNTLPVTDGVLHIVLYSITFDGLGNQTALTLVSNFKYDINGTVSGTIIESTFSGTTIENLTINQGLSFYLYQEARGALGGEKNVKLTVKANSFINSNYSQLNPPTDCKFALPFEIFTRLTESITNKPSAVQSEFFGRTDSQTVYSSDGEGSLFGNTNGFLLRQFTQDESQLSFKFKDYFQNLEKIWNIGVGVEKNNGDPFIRIEPKTYFFNNTIVLDLSDSIEPDSFSRDLEVDYFYSDIETGYSKSVDEQVSGLLEYNNKLDFNTFISNVENKLDLISNLVAGGFPIEFTRRKDKANFETEDTAFDNSNFIMGLFRSGGNLIQRTTQGYDTITGIPLVDTPINLDITPNRNARRWGWLLRVGLEKYLSKLIKFNKSKIKTDLATKKTGESTITENADIDPNQLEAPIFSGHIVKFNAPINLNTFEQVETNPYGLVQYFDPINKTTRFGWIQEMSTNPVDHGTNYVLIEALVNVDEEFYLLLENGNYLLQETGDRIIL